MAEPRGRLHPTLTRQAVTRAEDLTKAVGMEPDVRVIEKKRQVVWPTLEVRRVGEGEPWVLLFRGLDGEELRRKTLGDTVAESERLIAELKPVTERSRRPVA